MSFHYDSFPETTSDTQPATPRFQLDQILRSQGQTENRYILNGIPPPNPQTLRLQDHISNQYGIHDRMPLPDRDPQTSRNQVYTSNQYDIHDRMPLPNCQTSRNQDYTSNQTSSSDLNIIVDRVVGILGPRIEAMLKEQQVVLKEELGAVHKDIGVVHKDIGVVHKDIDELKKLHLGSGEWPDPNSRHPSLTPSDSASQTYPHLRPPVSRGAASGSPLSHTPVSAMSGVSVSPSAEEHEPPLLRPSQYPISILWTLADAWKDPLIGVNNNNKYRPAMRLCIRHVDGTPIEDVHWRTLHQTVLSICRFHLILAAGRNPNFSEKTVVSKTYLLTHNKKAWSKSVAMLEKAEPLLRLCANHWKAEHLLSRRLDALARSKRARSSGKNRPTTIGDNENDEDEDDEDDDGKGEDGNDQGGDDQDGDDEGGDEGGEDRDELAVTTKAGKRPADSTVATWERASQKKKTAHSNQSINQQTSALLQPQQLAASPEAPQPTPLPDIPSECDQPPPSSELQHSAPKSTSGTTDADETGAEQDPLAIGFILPPPNTISGGNGFVDISNIIVRPTYEALHRAISVDPYKNVTHSLDLLEALESLPKTAAKPSPALEEFITTIETADPNAEDMDEDNTNASWGHGHFRSGTLGLNNLSWPATWADVGTREVAYRVLAATIRTCRIARFLCFKRRITATTFLADLYFSKIVERLWEQVQLQQEKIASEPQNVVAPASGPSTEMTSARAKLQSLLVNELKALTQTHSIKVDTARKIPVKEDYINSLLKSSTSISAEDIDNLVKQRKDKAKPKAKAART